MAVAGPLRALFVAQGQALHNQLRREAGGAGLAGAVLVAILVPLALAMPTAGSFVIGSSLGADLTHPVRGARMLLTLSGMLLVVPLGLGFLGGVLGGEDEGGLSLRGYPVSRRMRLTGQLLSTSLGLAPMLAFSCLTGLAAGLGAARLTFTPVAVLLCAQAAIWVLIVQHVTSTMRALGLGRPVFALAVLSAGAIVIQLTLTGRPLFFVLARVLQAVLPYSPTTFGLIGLVDIESGRIATGWLRQLLPLAVTAAAVEVTARQAARAIEDGSRERRGNRVAPERLWSFQTPARGIARLFVSTITGSRHGLTLFFMPPFIAGTMVTVSSTIAGGLRRAPLPPFLAGLAPGSLDTLPIFGILPALLVHMNSELSLNQWGWDGRVVRTLFTAPIATRDLLVGKLMGFSAIVLAELMMTAPLLAFLRPPRAAELLWGVGAGAFALVVAAGLGHVLSAGLARPLDAYGRIGRTEGFAGMIASMLVLVSVLPPIAFVYAIARPWGEWGLALGLWSLAAAGFAVYWRALPFLGQRVRDMREEFLEAT